ncbi:integrase arm-type DNA-binding domain-containing protein [Asticcacaulis sp. YBE204]|uniref:tyrosine-type recombinase/integrase n=1 Tax=Asticcacaulis sp. YBE204 TaxID=1282363 RepID=UPI0003C40BA8|nr:integrase arm-type DNA-binding domain-containing protein [Asticcacaulis sp. YBE204]ESQ80736.1 integrase [Asticcacaulis sp. YBE204]
MALSDASIRAAKAQAKPYKLTDGGGLFLLVTPAGGKLWRFKYRYNGAEKLLALGVYPEVGLKQARQRHDEAKKLLANGVDPNADKKRQALAATLSASNTFDSIAAELIDLKEREGLSVSTLIKQKWFRSQLQSAIGDRPVSDIEPMEVLAALKAIERRGNYETSKRTRAFADRVFRYAIITGRAKANPATGLGDALISGKVKHHAAIIDAAGVGTLLRAINAYEGSVLTKLATQLLAHVFVRPGELRHAEWSEIDFDRAVWLIPAAKMKMRADHAVPLSMQALAILNEAKALRVNSRYVFPSLVSSLKPMSENTVNMGLRRMGYTNEEMTAHGFRSTASTLLNESGKWSSDAIERALAHKDGDAIRGIYHRGKHWDERVKMAQWWSDYLDRLCAGGEVVPLRREG